MDAFWNCKRERAWLFGNEEHDFTTVGFRQLLRLCIYAKSLQSCPTLCDPMDCSLPDSSVPTFFQARINGVGCQTLLQGIFQTQGLNPRLLTSPALVGRLFTLGAPLVLLWLRLHSPTAGARVQSLVRELVPTCHN